MERMDGSAILTLHMVCHLPAGMRSRSKSTLNTLRLAVSTCTGLLFLRIVVVVLVIDVTGKGQ